MCISQHVRWGGALQCCSMGTPGCAANIQTTATAVHVSVAGYHMQSVVRPVSALIAVESAR
jgi:hypothetical protein